MQRRRFLGIGLLAGLAASLGGCAGGGEPRAAGSGATVLDVARGAGLGRFARAAEDAGLGATLAGPGPFTLFAPTDRAFAAAGRPDGEALQRLVAYHVIPGQLTSDFLEGVEVNHTTLLGSSLSVDGTGDGLRVNGAAVVRADLIAANGVVFAIDRALTPR